VRVTNFPFASRTANKRGFPLTRSSPRYSYSSSVLFLDAFPEIFPSEHFVQIYEDDSVFMDNLEKFITGGLHAEDGVIVIATGHISALLSRVCR
jgi:hypothetical protein